MVVNLAKLIENYTNLKNLILTKSIHRIYNIINLEKLGEFCRIMRKEINKRLKEINELLEPWNDIKRQNCKIIRKLLIEKEDKIDEINKKIINKKRSIVKNVIFGVFGALGSICALISPLSTLAFGIIFGISITVTALCGLFSYLNYSQISKLQQESLNIKERTDKEVNQLRESEEEYYNLIKEREVLYSAKERIENKKQAKISSDKKIESKNAKKEETLEN